MATIGMDRRSIKFQSPDKTSVVVDMWDTAGQERFHSLVSSFYRHADGVIVLFDLTCLSSFKDTKQWFKRAVLGVNEGVPFTLVGTKKDLEYDRKVSKAEAMELASQMDMNYFETSAITGTGIGITLKDIFDKSYFKAKRDKEKIKIEMDKLKNR